MKRWIIIVLLVVGVVWLVAERMKGGKETESVEAPPVELHTLDVADVIDYTEMASVTYRVRTTRDVLPGGLSAAMAPAFVVWGQSDFSPGGTITIRNVNHGGNPVSGVTVLRIAVVHPDRLLHAEYIMVPLGGPEAISHGQIRFVFAEGGVELLGGDTAAVGEPESVTDLVLSWEAWRAPGVDYSVMKGLDPNVYHLSMRAYSGVQRFLEDALQKRDWKVYTLQLPGEQAGAVELLKVCLALGDGAARYVLSEMLERAEDDWLAAGPHSDKQGGDAVALWHEIGAGLGDAHTGGDARIDMAGHTGYQTALRSCATMALYQVDVATARLIEQGYPHDAVHPTGRASITNDQDWMSELANASIAGVFLHAPKAISFVHKNPSAVPGNIPGELDEAGLLVHENGKVVKQEFTISGETPWGPADQLLIK